jgi:tetratricopeptide (TPR) repeat protein
VDRHGLAPPTSAGTRPEEPFVGRSAELARLEELLEQALLGAGSIALITGEAGIGKTALVGQFLRRARQRDPSLVLCRGRCVEQYGTGEAYLPFLDALGTLLVGRTREETGVLLRTYAPTWCLQLPALAVSPDSRDALQHQTIGATKERMLREMGDVFEAASSSALLVGFLEDVQWADPSTADLVRHLVNRIARQRILLLATLRPGELQAPEHPLRGFVADLRTHSLGHEIPLGPLGPDQVAALLDARFRPHRLPADLAELVYRRTEGHPLFVTSLLQLLLDRGDIVCDAGTWALTRPVASADVDAPESVRALVRRKVESLTEADRVALQHASVMGTEFLSTILARLLGVEEVGLEERLVRLDRTHRLIDKRGEEELPDGSLATRYRFSNALIQEVLYDDLVSARRVLMHRQAGEHLVAAYGGEAPRIAGPLALHFERGRNFAAAITYLAHAGDNAARLNANSEAEEYLRRAVALVEKLPAEQRAERAMDLHHKRGTFRLASSRFAEAAESFAAMLELARSVQRAAPECLALSGLCNALFFSDRMEEMAVRATQALQAADRAGSGALRVEAMLLVGQILQHEGNLGDCKALLEDVIALARRGGHRRPLVAGLTYRGVVHYWQSEYAAAEERFAEALPLASELRDGMMVLICLQFQGLTLANRGRMSRALAALAEGMEMGQRNGDRFWLPRLASHVGWVHRELQDFERAIEHDRSGLAIAREYGVVQAEASALLNLCLDYTHAGDLDAAEEVFQQLEAHHRAADWFGWLNEIRLQSALAEHWVERGDWSRASTHAQRLLVLAEPLEAHTYVATARKALFEVALASGDLDGAGVHIESALQEVRSHSCPLYAWKLDAAMGRFKERTGDREAACAAYREGAGVIRAIAGGVDDEDLKRVFLDAPAVRAVLEREGRA